MVNLMIRSRERGIKFNKDKVHLKCQEVSFFGHKRTRKGIKPDDSNISAIQKMTPPFFHSFLPAPYRGWIRASEKRVQDNLHVHAQEQGQPVCYFSKSLTDTERNYSNIERETLGVVWGLERFKYYTFGKQCTINTNRSLSDTNHKPLEARQEIVQLPA